MDVVEQRKTAMRAARFCYEQMGMSKERFQDAVDMNDFQDLEVNEALWALKKRGELEHLIEFVWTFRK